MEIRLRAWQIKASTILMYLIAVSNAYGQQLRKHSVDADIRTSGPVYAVNYGCIFHQRERIAYTYRIGFHWLNDEVGIPPGVSLITGKQNHHPEAGIQAAFAQMPIL
ncbi:hypothetical protein [Flavitalea sp.]|nr:hypothetical protein [Flavitalea sp.]